MQQTDNLLISKLIHDTAIALMMMMMMIMILIIIMMMMMIIIIIISGINKYKLIELSPTTNQTL